MSGSIPAQISALTALTELYVPSFQWALASLSDCWHVLSLAHFSSKSAVFRWLGSNDLTGTISSEISALTDLQSLSAPLLFDEHRPSQWVLTQTPLKIFLSIVLTGASTTIFCLVPFQMGYQLLWSWLVCVLPLFLFINEFDPVLMSAGHDGLHITRTSSCPHHACTLGD